MPELRGHGSLKHRLLLLALGTVLVVWIGATAFAYFDAREELDEVLDVYLEQTAALLVVQASHDVEDIDVEHVPQLGKLGRKIVFQIWEGDTGLRLHSLNAPSVPLADQEPGLSDSTADGHRWRVFTTWDDYGRYRIHVAERTDVRDALARAIAGNLLKPLWLSLPLLAIMLWIAVTRGLRPLVKLTGDVARREPDNLAPLDTGPAPQEVLPLIERLNALFVRIGTFMQRERRFTADAAHELRTPIAGIKAQAQVALAASNGAERVHALDNAILGCDRAAHLIDQLLTLARLDTLGDETTEPCQLASIAADVIASIAPSALSQNIHIELAEEQAVQVRGNAALLHILLRNLVDNAVRHTRTGTTVLVAIGDEHGQNCLTVTDNGPGIPEAELERVSERFYRPAGTSASGSGLGLSIVKRIADIHAASLKIEPVGNGTGLRVCVIFKS